MTEKASLLTDEYFMRMALKQAEQAFEEDEVPIGAVIVSNDKIIATGYNRTEQLCDVTAHAEIMAITAAQLYLGAKFLTDCDLFVSIEPCIMCAGAIRWARLRRVVFGAFEPKFGYSRFSEEVLHPSTSLVRGVCEEEAALLMKSFFRKKRG